MIVPLTPEEICELDTFTLQEKIEQLENHPRKQLFSHIIKIAKLELIDRLEIQQFGRMLANDEYKFDFDFKPPVIPEAKPQVFKHLGSSTINRKEIMTKIQSNLVSAGSYVVIGKPAVNHRYKAKVKKLQPVQQTKRTFLKAKKQAMSVSKVNKIMKKPFVEDLNSDTHKKADVKVETKAQSKVVMEQLQNRVTQEKKIIETKQEMSLKQRLKKEVKEMKVVYCQNDAYDDMLGVTIKPLNLKDEEIKILNEEKVKQQVSEVVEQIRVNTQTRSQKSYNQSVKIQEEIQNQIQHSSLIQVDKYQTDKSTAVRSPEQKQVAQKFQVLHQHFAEQPPQISIYEEQQRQSISQVKKDQQPTPKVQKSQKQREQTLNEQKIRLSSINFNSTNRDSIVKQNKSKSVKNFQKRIIHNVDTEAAHFQVLTCQIATKMHPTHQKSASIKLLNQKSKTKKLYQKPIVSDNRYLLRSTATKIQTNVYPYHQIIPTFQKLFPHSKNLLVTLRNVEQNLRLHFDKDLNSKSKNNEYVHLNEKQLVFKLVTQSQKAKKHAKLFNIQLQSFHKRNSIMLNRINNQFQPPPDNQMQFYRVVRTKEEVYDIINSSFHRTQTWFQLPHGMELKNSWNLLWTWSKPQIDFQDLFYFQKVNHFIGNKQIARKDLLKKNIQKIQKLSNKMKNYFDIIPETFLLPGQNIAFIKKFRQYSLKDPLNYWILKPVGLSRGRGISLINKLQEVVFSEPIVLQKYIMNPLLVDGFKFDMRIYVLVTSMNPLQAFVYKQGFARLSTERYSVSQEMMDNKFIHLTNFSIQRQNLSGEKKLTFQEEIGGSKISLKMLAQRLSMMGIPWGNIQKQIQDIILKSLISCMNVIPQNPNCFQLFGYDIFIDSDLKCWLLEVNSSPSLQKEYTLDEVIKQQLVDDIVEIVQPVNYDRERLLEVVERRRREAEGLKSSINTNNNSQQQLNEDLNYILHGRCLRKYGTLNDHSNFKLIAPSEKYFQIIKTLQHYKIDPIIKNQT